MISVIVPARNAEKYLTNCITSIENQTYEDIEIIIINDGSTDNTESVINSLCQQNNKISSCTLKGEGVSVARNKGIELSSGEYICFVDADDILHPLTLSVLLKDINDYNADIAGCSFIQYSSIKDSITFLSSTDANSDYSVEIYTQGKYITEQLLNGNTRCWSKLYRKSILDAVQFQTGLSIGEDLLFLTDILSPTIKITENSFNGYGYFQNPVSAINKPFTPAYMDQITCWELVRQRLMLKTADSSLQKSWQRLISKHLLLAILLTVGKYSELSFRDRLSNIEYKNACYQTTRRELSTLKGNNMHGYYMLSKGSRLKIKIFYRLPSLYIFLYHFHKYKAKV